MKRATSFRLSKEALYLLAQIARKNGISQTAVLEIIIREKARSEGINSRTTKAEATE